jgi:uncharacterized protein
MHPFVVSVTSLLRSPGAIQRERRSAPIAGLGVTSSRVPAGSNVDVDVALESVHGGVMARGTVRAAWEGDCRRCLQPAAGTLSAEVAELFQRDSDPETTYPLRGDQLDLEPLARDAVLLELPPVPLCDEGCRGLCSMCGADRNVDPCSCEPLKDDRWAALDALRTDQ